MTNLPASHLSVGYCTNVHAGVDLPTIQNNLQQYAVAARDVLDDGEPLGLGLWLPFQAAQELRKGGAADFAAWLKARNLRTFTINGFPYDNFHQPVVKHRVYHPPWWLSERLEYTKCLAEVLVELLPEDEAVGSISTLPIGWPTDAHGGELLNQAAENLRELAHFLQQLEARSGRRIVVAIEPEPGCILDTSDTCLNWFSKYLPDTVHRRYITVCHDICHAAVMMESQQDVISRLAEAGIGVGKVQVSSAIVADWQSMTISRRHAAIEQLAAFAEDRYLHQTGRVTEDGGFALEEDLPEFLERVSVASQIAGADADPVNGDFRWIVHFHVPIFLERFGHLTTSHADVRECLRTLLANPSPDRAAIDFTGHLEVETYAWSVLPESMRRRGLAEDIASEIRWLRGEIAKTR